MQKIVFISRVFSLALALLNPIRARPRRVNRRAQRVHPYGHGPHSLALAGARFLFLSRVIGAFVSAASASSGLPRPVKSSVAYLLPVVLLLGLSGCQDRPATATQAAEIVALQGKTMGTTYTVKIRLEDQQSAADAEALQAVFDSALVALNEEVSNWEKGSTVVRFNASENGMYVGDAPHFIANFLLAKKMAEATGGAFEPTILPLTDYWGFGAGKERIEAGVDTAEVLRRLALVDITQLEWDANNSFLKKNKPGIQLDLGGSAKGYGVDLLAQLLKDRGYQHFLIEIGGEMYASGRKGEGQWIVGINVPEEDASFRDIAKTMPLEDRAVATSGNYRNYYKLEATTFSHTLNPKTGFPERNSLLSASILAPDCATADAYATACMVLGPEGAMQLIQQRPEIEGYLLVRTPDGGMEALFSWED